MRFWLLALLPLLLFPLGLRVNLTRSMPVGLYWLDSNNPTRGDFVTFCAPERWSTAGYTGRGLCPGDTKPLLKQLCAVPGDTVEIAQDGQVLINGQLIQNSQALTIDRAGHVLSSDLDVGVVPAGFGLAFGRSTASFDSRYFGLVPLGAMRRAIFLIPFSLME